MGWQTAAHKMMKPVEVKCAAPVSELLSSSSPLPSFLPFLRIFPPPQTYSPVENLPVRRRSKISQYDAVPFRTPKGAPPSYLQVSLLLMFFFEIGYLPMWIAVSVNLKNLIENNTDINCFKISSNGFVKIIRLEFLVLH